MSDRELLEDNADRIQILEEVVGTMILQFSEFAEIFEGLGGM